MANSVTTVNHISASYTATPADSPNWNESSTFAPGVAVAHPDEQSVATTAAGNAVPYGAVSALGTPGEIAFKNLDPTNYVEIGLQISGTFYPFARIDPGRIAGPFQIADSVALYWRAHTAAVLTKLLLLSR